MVFDGKVYVASAYLDAWEARGQLNIFGTAGTGTPLRKCSYSASKPPFGLRDGNGGERINADLANAQRPRDDN